MKSYSFSVVIDDDCFEDGRKAYHAYCPALKGCRTWGSTFEEAFANIQEAVELYLEVLMEDGQDIPVDPIVGEGDAPSVVVNV